MMQEKVELSRHWENIYQTKNLTKVGWHQPFPSTSVDLIEQTGVESGIIDVGGGDSRLTDYLVSHNFADISVLDISASALAQTKKRLAGRSGDVDWIHADISVYQPDRTFQVWHDRAAFHFLTDRADISRYVKMVKESVQTDGYAIIGTFSITGPETCSGLRVHQYSKASLAKLFEPEFKVIKCFYTDHITPAGDAQNYVFGLFQKLP